MGKIDGDKLGDEAKTLFLRLAKRLEILAAGAAIGLILGLILLGLGGKKEQIQMTIGAGVVAGIMLSLALSTWRSKERFLRIVFLVVALLVLWIGASAADIRGVALIPTFPQE